MPEPSSGILGRISGKLLSVNLERDGIDLTFRNNPLDADLLYLDVNNLRVGINQTPGFDLHISNGISTNGIVENQLTIANNDLILAASQISSLTSAITLSPDQSFNPSIIMERNQTSELEINDNYISNYTIDGSINVTSSGTGIIRLENDTVLDGDLHVTGNITVAGNLSKQGNLIIGDDVIDGEGNVPENDTVDFNVPFAQNLLPGLDGSYDLGGSRGDSSAGRWAELYVTDNLVNTADILTLAATVSDQILINGATGEISTTQSNDDLILSPDSGIIYVEELKFEPRLPFELIHTLDNPNAYGTSANDDFGTSVAISGDRCIVGARDEDEAGGSSSGKAYIFNVVTGALVHTLDNPNAYGSTFFDRFGERVAISGDRAIVVSTFEDDAGGSSSGKAYIFNVVTGALVHTLDNPNAFGTSAGDNFGRSVAISGDRCIVGTGSEGDAGGTSSGKAYIFDVSTGALLHTLDNPNAFGTSASDNFGGTTISTAVAIDGDRCIVGAHAEDDAGGTSSGKAYIFDVSTGALLHTLDNPNAYGTSAGDSFGLSVAISGDRCIVGAHAEDDAGGTSSGKAYIFDVSTGALLHTLDNPNAYGTSAGDSFGLSVAISGDRCIVGAQSEGDAGGTSSGKAYIFDVSTGVLLQTLDNPNAFGTSAGDSFGTSVAISGDRCIVAASGEDDAGGTSSGKAYIFGQDLDSKITNLNTSTPVQFASTGTGYYNFSGTNGMVFPAGITSERVDYEVGATRWNTDTTVLECFDGTTWNLSTGAGEVTIEEMEELGVLYTLILG